MSSRRASSGFEAQKIYEVFDSKGVVFGTAANSPSGFVYVQPQGLQGRNVVAPFYVSAHPRSTPATSHFKDLCMRAVLMR